MIETTRGTEEGAYMRTSVSDDDLERAKKTLQKYAEDGMGIDGMPLSPRQTGLTGEKAETAGGGTKMTVSEARENAIRNRFHAQEQNSMTNWQAQQRNMAKRIRELEEQLAICREGSAEFMEQNRAQRKVISVLNEGMKLAWGEDWVQRLRELSPSQAG